MLSGCGNGKIDKKADDFFAYSQKEKRSIK